jgi:hypothetical protein
MPLDALIKIDLAEVNIPHRQGGIAGLLYDHSPEPSSVVRERNDKLSYVLGEIKSLREEMERRLPK